MAKNKGKTSCARIFGTRKEESYEKFYPPPFRLIFLVLALLAPPLALSNGHDGLQAYAGVDLSQNRVRHVANDALGSCAATCSTLESGPRVFVGIKGAEDLPASLELFYTSSEHQVTFSRFVVDPNDPLSFQSITGNYTTEYSNLGIVLNYHLEIFENLTIAPGLGISFLSLDTTGPRLITANLSGTGLMFNIGAEYDFSETVSARVGYDWVDSSPDEVTGSNLYYDDVMHGYAGLVVNF